MKVTPIAGMMRSSDKDERGDAERKRLELFLKLIDEMDIPPQRIQHLRGGDEGIKFRSLKWLDRNIAINNSNHENFQQARNLLRMIMKSEWKKRW